MAAFFTFVALLALGWLAGAILFKLVGFFVDGVPKHLISIALAIPLCWWLGGAATPVIKAMLEA